MTTNELSALKIYWDGTILSTPVGVDYVSGKSELVELTNVVNFAQLQVVIRRVIGMKDGDEIVKIYLRVHRFDEHGRFQKYDGFPMETDVHMEAMWRNVSRTPQMRDDDDDDIGGENGDGTHGENVGGGSEQNTDHFESRLPHEYTHQNVDDMCVNMNLWPKENAIWEAGKEFELGMVFSSRYAVQTCAASYHIAANKEYKSSQTTGKTIVLVCVNNDTCNWRGTREDRRDVTSPPIEPSIPPHRLPVIPDAPIDPTTLRHRRRERRHPPAPPQRPTDPMPPPVVFHPFRGHYYYAGSSSAPPPFSSGPPSSSGQFYGDSAHHYFQGSCSYPVPPGPSSPFVPPPPAYVPPTVPPFQVQWDQPTQGTQDFPASQGLPETPGTTDFLSYGSSWLGLDSMEAMMFRQQEEFVTPPPATTSTAIPEDQQGDDGDDDEDADAGEGDGDGRPGRHHQYRPSGEP
ncbi:formin-like protein 7 [Mercurialis annua]|uniref:formin-like protein 7 n=1 Tax=Mercurialis annua TaxID=3986 RepID=UPI00215E5A0B|nr:formin-like protein 7 [Mercurialis annua]